MLCVHCAYIIWILAWKQKEENKKKLKKNKKKTQEILSVQQRARPFWDKVCQVSLYSSKNVSAKGFLTNPSNKWFIRLSSFFNLEIENKEVKLIQVFFSLLLLLLFKFSSTWILVRFVVLLFFKVEMTWMEVLWENRRGALPETDTGAWSRTHAHTHTQGQTERDTRTCAHSVLFPAWTPTDRQKKTVSRKPSRPSDRSAKLSKSPRTLRRHGDAMWISCYYSFR